MIMSDAPRTSHPAPRTALRTALRTPHSAPRTIRACFACLFDPARPDQEVDRTSTLLAVAQEFSPRYKRHGDRLIVIDVSGLDHLIGPPRVVGEELRREAGRRGTRVHVALARMHTTARLLALACPGLTVVEPGEESTALAALPIRILERLDDAPPVSLAVTTLDRWGLKTLGELAALPAADLSARLGQQGLAWQAIAQGRDVRPFQPDSVDERFDAFLELEWPIEGVEPLSFVLTRLLEPLSVRLERRDRGAAVLELELGLVSKDVYARRLELPAPLRDVRTLRTLMLLDLESHPPSAAIDRVTLVIQPTPGRVLQHTLFTRAQPAPERLSTLLARLGALMGQDRLGAPSTVDSYRPGAFTVVPFAADRDVHRQDQRERKESFETKTAAISTPSGVNVVSALRRLRRPMPARVVADGDRPSSVRTDRQGFTGGAVLSAAGPWRTSGAWWTSDEACGPGRSGGEPYKPCEASWNCDEWDVALADGSVYRIFRDRDLDSWFIEGIFD